MKKAKKRLIIVSIFILLCGLGIVGVSYYQLRHPGWNLLEYVETLFESKNLFGYKKAEIVELIVGENRDTQELKVKEQDLSAKTIITENLFNLDIFKKEQTVEMFATASYTVDLSKVKEEDIIIDKDTKTITIVIPHAVLDTLEMHYDMTTFSDVQHELLAFGDIHLTPEQQNEIQNNLSQTMKEEASSKEMLDVADESAKKQIEQLYRILLKDLSQDAKIDVVFDHHSSENLQ